MQRGSLNDFLSFLAVAREKSFTRAAAKLGVAQSTLSHTIRELEARLGVRLLARTTRSVGLTDVGERLFRTVAPRLASASPPASTRRRPCSGPRSPNSSRPIRT